MNSVVLSDEIDDDLVAELAYHMKKVEAAPERKPASLGAALPSAPVLTGALCSLTPHPDLCVALWATALAALLVLPVPVEVAASSGDVCAPPLTTDFDADEVLNFWTPPDAAAPQRALAVDVIAFASSGNNNTALAVRLHLV